MSRLPPLLKKLTAKDVILVSPAVLAIFSGLRIGVEKAVVQRSLLEENQILFPKG